MIVLDGYKLDYFGLVCEKQTNPMTPIFENKTLAVPGRVGLYNFGTEIRERLFEFQIGVIDKNKTLLQHRLRDFISFLFDAYGKSREIKLSYEYEPDTYYLVHPYTQINPERVSRTGKFTLGLAAYNPHANSQIYADELRWGNDVITFQSHYKLGHPGSDGVRTLLAPATLNVYTDGLANKPVIEITGSATNLVIGANGYEVSLGTFTSTSWLINCEAYTIKKNGVNTFLANFRDFILLKGNNQVQISGTGINISLHIKLRDKYN